MKCLIKYCKFNVIFLLSCSNASYMTKLICLKIKRLHYPCFEIVNKAVSVDGAANSKWCLVMLSKWTVLIEILRIWLFFEHFGHLKYFIA